MTSEMIPTQYTIGPVKIWLNDGDSFIAEIDEYKVGHWISIVGLTGEQLLIPWSSILSIRSESLKKSRKDKK